MKGAGRRSARTGPATISPTATTTSIRVTFASGSAVDLAHDDVDAPDDGRHVGDQAAAAQLAADAQVAEAARPRPHPQRHGLLARPADHVEPHLPPRALRLDVALAGAKRP